LRIRKQPELCSIKDISRKTEPFENWVTGCIIEKGLGQCNEERLGQRINRKKALNVFKFHFVV